MSEIKILKVDSQIEKRIITGMIVSKKILRELSPLFNLDYFKNQYARLAARWCLDFYATYEDAPFMHIQDIFNLERSKMDDDTAGLIENLLAEISDRYDQEKGLNEEYLLTQAMDYMKRRELEIISGNIQVLLERNNVRGAEEQVLNYNQIIKATLQATDIFDDKCIEEVFNDDRGIFFQLTGALGNYLGNMEPGWLVGMSGGYKRGKTWMLHEFLLRAMLLRLKTVYFSFEMKRTQIAKRLFMRISGAGENGNVIIPVFDCKYNQNNECELACRSNHCGLLNPQNKKPRYSSELSYRPCTVCRGSEAYDLAYWKTQVKRPVFMEDAGPIIKRINALKKLYRKYIRVISYPRFSAGIPEIKHDLKVLEQTEDFIPQVILIDYAEIIKSKGIKFGDVDEIWKELGGLAGEKSVLLVTPTQVTSEGLEASTLQERHTGLWKGKLGHVDAMITLNQTDQEYEDGVLRVGLMEHRHKGKQKTQCFVLQQLGIGQALLDSEIGVYRG